MAIDLVLGLPRRSGDRPLTDGLLVAEPGSPGPLVLSAAADAEAAADVLAAAAHGDAGLVGLATDAAGVLRLLAGTVAALRGDDVRAAWARPDVVAVRAVPAPAAEALREVLRHVLVPDVARVAEELAALGLTGLS